jgi:hypothetical protein
VDDLVRELEAMRRKQNPSAGDVVIKSRVSRRPVTGAVGGVIGDIDAQSAQLNPDEIRALRDGEIETFAALAEGHGDDDDYYPLE